MPFLHGIKDTVVRDKARTMLQEEPLKHGCSGRNVRRNGNGTME
jgi:hypothetical protein